MQPNKKSPQKQKAPKKKIHKAQSTGVGKQLKQQQNATYMPSSLDRKKQL
jgi:hypothetical protein